MVTKMRIGCVCGLLALSAAGCKSTSTRESAIPLDADIETVKSDAPNAAMHVAAGDLALMQNNRDEAIKQYERALILDPKKPDALYKLATVRVYDRNFDEATNLWKRYIVATKQSAEGYSNLGRTYELAGNWKEAEVSYLDAIHKDPASKQVRVNYGILLAKRDRVDEAETQLGYALSPAEVQYNLGSVFELRKNFPAARIAYGKAIDADPSLKIAQQRLAMLKDATASIE